MAYKKDLNQEESEQSPQSRINAAGLISITLENLWRDCYSAMAKGNYILMNSKLDAIWAILGGDEPEGGDEEKKINWIDLKIYQTGNLHARIGKGFEKVNNPNSPLLYQLLKKKALMLRRLQNKQGKGSAYASDDDDDIS